MTSAEESLQGPTASSTTDASSDPPEHPHRWSGVAFYLEDEQPWFRMKCACGAERSIRAWERYSEPERDPDDPATAVEG